jgi:hypothetical protein
MTSPVGTRRNVISVSFVVGALLIAVASVAGTYLVTSSYDAAHPIISAVTSVSTVSLTLPETSYVTQTQLSLQTHTVTAEGGYGYEYGYGQSCYGGCYHPQYPQCGGYPYACTTLNYQVVECNAYRWLQSGQSCIAGSLSYQGSCLLMYDSYDGNTYVLLGYGAPTPSGDYVTAVGYVLSYSSSTCTGIPFQVSYFLPTG